jgi:hypothetical protein
VAPCAPSNTARGDVRCQARIGVGAYDRFLVPGEDDLYGLPLERFVPERTALTKALRAEGRREDAARVAKLRKPSLAAWAVNQLARTQRRGIDALFGAGEELQRAHADLIEGNGDAGALRAATERERAAVDELVGAARGLLSADGHELTQATLDRVAETLRAAAIDPDARAQVRDGRIERELRHVGLGAVGFPSAPSRPSADDGEGAERMKAARQEEQRFRRDAARAARELETAQRRRDRAAGAVGEAQEALREAERTLEQTERALATAQERADATAEEHARAKRARRD